MSSQVPYHSAIVLDELPLWTAEFDAYGILSRLIPRGNSIDVDEPKAVMLTLVYLTPQLASRTM